jgi:hypothetical protein
VEWRSWKTVYVIIGVVVGLLITCCLTWRSVSTHDRNPFWFCGFTLLVLGLAAVICWQASSPQLNTQAAWHSQTSRGPCT